MSGRVEVSLDSIDFDDPTTAEWIDTSLEHLEASATTFSLFRRIAPKDACSRELDRVIGYLVSIEKYQHYVFRSPYLSDPRRENFRTLIETFSHKRLAQQAQKRQVTPVSAALSLKELVTGLLKVFSVIMLEDFTNAFDLRRNELNRSTGVLAQSHKSLTRPDSDFVSLYKEFKDAKKTISNQLFHVRLSLRPGRCTSIFKKLVFVEGCYGKMLQALNKRGVVTNARSASVFRHLKTYVFDLRTALLYRALVHRMHDHFLELDDITPSLKLQVGRQRRGSPRGRGRGRTRSRSRDSDDDTSSSESEGEDEDEEEE
jgi:hypothetical protein